MKFSYLLILMASALLLSGLTESVITPSPPPQPNVQTQTAAHQDSPVTSPEAPGLKQYVPIPGAQPSTAITYNYYSQPQPFGNLSGWLEAGATIGLVIFAAYQIGFLKRSTNAPETAAEAAAQAANAAKATADIAARSERPVLVAENFVPLNINRKEEVSGDRGITLVELHIRNCGKGPALGLELVGNIKLAADLPYPPYFGDCTPIPLRSSVVEATTNIRAFVPYAPQKPAVLLSEIDSIRIEDGQISLFVYGWIAYRDLHGNRYDTQFSVKYLSIIFGGGEQFYPSPQKYNRHNEYGPENTALSKPE